MKTRLRNILGQARHLEATIAAKIERTTRRVTGSSTRQPLEIAHAIVDAVEQEIQPAGRGQRAFPFNQVRVSLLSPTPRSKAVLQVVCDGPPSLRQRVLDRLRAAGCHGAEPSLTVSFVTKARAEWTRPEFHVECTRRSAAEPAAVDPGARLELTVTSGTTGRTSYSFLATAVAIGRGAEVRDQRQRLIRTNHVAFTEGAGEINQSVSRRHAHIEHDRAASVYRVFDDSSAQGTTVVRAGRGLAVPRGTKGMGLQSGDELVLGQARIKVRIQ